MSKQTLKKIGNVTLNVLLYIFLAICVFSVIMTITSKKDSDGAAEIFGYQLRLVISPSMEKCEYTDVSEFEIKSMRAHCFKMHDKTKYGVLPKLKDGKK